MWGWPGRSPQEQRGSRPLVTNEQVEVQDFRKFTHNFRGISRINPDKSSNTRRCRDATGWTWKHLGSQPIMPENLPGHWAGEADIVKLTM